MPGKQDRTKAARMQFEIVQEEYQKEVSRSVRYAQVFDESLFNREEQWEEIQPSLSDTQMSVFEGSPDMALESEAVGKSIILDFASFLRPGGSFLSGGEGQEEDLCHVSTLYNVLNFCGNYFEKNKELKNHGMYANRAIIVPEIVFTKSGKTSDVVACSAPNLNAFTQYVYNAGENPNMDIESFNEKILQHRISFLRRVIELGEYNSNDTIILGAWGCGKYGQKVKKIAQYLTTYFHKSSAQKIIFAIPEEDQYYIETFKSAIENF